MMISTTDAVRYQLNAGYYAVYGFEYKPGFAQDDAVPTFPPLLRC